MARKAVTDDFKVFSERLSALMKERNVTQEELAHELGIKRQTVSLYKNGQSTPDAAQLKKIATFFDVSADWLLGISNVKSTKADVRHVCDYIGLSQEAVVQLHDIFISKAKRPAAIDIVNEVAYSASLFNDCLYRSILADAQYKKVLSRYSVKDIQAYWEKKDLERIEDAFDPLESIKDGIEVSAGEAAVLFEIQAVENIKRAAEKVIYRYRQEIIPLMTKEC